MLVNVIHRMVTQAYTKKIKKNKGCAINMQKMSILFNDAMKGSKEFHYHNTLKFQRILGFKKK